MSLKASEANRGSEAMACEHCGALVYSDCTHCSQCGFFPVKLHRCPECGCIAAGNADLCWRCGRMFEPKGDYL
jgi:hypothetical protein